MYTTYAEVLALSGTALPQATVESMIAAADRDVNTYCAAQGVSVDATNSAIVSASINYTMAYILTRGRMDGTREVTSLDYTDKTPIDNAIKTYRDTADELLQRYCKAAASVGTSRGLFSGGIVNQ
jgi:hypothetical protein